MSCFSGHGHSNVVTDHYRNAGDRAIRIDMLERLADLLRVQDSRGGFEATADMLSITGMTLEQFANLMEGLGYVAARAEREKQRVEAPVSAPQAIEAEAVAEDTSETPAEGAAEAPVAETEAADAEAEAPEMEVFYTFTWGRKPKPRPQEHISCVHFLGHLIYDFVLFCNVFNFQKGGESYRINVRCCC